MVLFIKNIILNYVYKQYEEILPQKAVRVVHKNTLVITIEL